MNREMKVGIVVFAGLLLLGTLVFLSGGARFSQKGYDIGVVFSDAMGLDIGAPVFVSGIESGRVNQLKLLDDGVMVTVKMRKDVKIPCDSLFTIDTGGLLGEPRVKISRGSDPECLISGSQIYGAIPPSFDEILGDIRTGLEEIQGTFRNVNVFMEKLSNAAGDFQAFSQEARDQIQRAGDTIVALGENIDSVLLENRTDLRNTVRNLSSVLGRVDSILASFDSDGLSGEDMRNTVVRIGAAASQVEELVNEIEDAFFDPVDHPVEGGEAGRPPKATSVRDVRGMVDSARRIITTIEDWYMQGRIGIRGVDASASGKDVRGDMSLWLGRRSSGLGFLAAIEEIGGDTGYSAAAGFQSDMMRFWAGAVHGHPGGGLLVYPESNAGSPYFQVQWWDEDSGVWAFEGGYSVTDDWGLYFRRTERDSGDENSAGVFYRF